MQAVTALQLGQLVNLNPIDLLGDSIPDVGVPPLNVPNLLGVQFLGARQSLLYPTHLFLAACLQTVILLVIVIKQRRLIFDVNGVVGFSVANFAVSNNNLSVSIAPPAHVHA